MILTLSSVSYRDPPVINATLPLNVIAAGAGDTFTSFVVATTATVGVVDIFVLEYFD
jgi:hypothetical protein